MQFDNNDLLYVYLDRRRRRRKFLITTLLRSIGYSADVDILNLFYEIKDLKVAKALDMENVSTLVLVEDAIDAQKGVVLARAFEPLTKQIVRTFEKHEIASIRVIDTAVDEGAIIRALKKDPTRNEEEALKEIYKRLRPGEPPTTANAKALLKRLFFDPKRYDLGRVGRYKVNQKLGLKADLEQRILESADIVAATKYLVRLRKGRGRRRRHRPPRQPPRPHRRASSSPTSAGSGLSRTERLVRERMTMYDQSVDSITPQKLINPKALTTVIRDFFARSQLSQFMDQINPLAEVTHKRRLSALGPGGLNRERAGFEVRDVHPSHYGRICPIETPEGPNIGLINSLSTYARVNEFGFIETPYRVVKEGRATDKIDYLTADQEEAKVIAQANSEIDDKGHFVGKVTVRKDGEFLEVGAAEVDYMDVSPKQVISIAAGMIPFLEHDDANRALMGSNMQRQGVPLLQAEAPFVGTGIEERVARDSKIVVVADEAGVVASVDAKRIVVTKDGELPRNIRHDPKNHVYVYELRKFMRSNAGTCFNQKPIVRRGPEDQGRRDHRRRPLDRPRRDGPRAQRPRRLHALERLQLRGRDPDLREGPQGGHLHLDPHPGVRGHRPRHQARARGDHPRHPERRRGGPEEPRPQRRHPRRRGGEARRHPRRQDHAQVRDRARPRGEAPAGDLRREGRGREGHLARRPLRGRRHHHGRQGLVPHRQRAGEALPLRPPPPDQADPGGLQDPDGQAARGPHRGALQHPPRREDPARRHQRRERARSSSRPTARSPRPSCASWPPSPSTSRSTPRRSGSRSWRSSAPTRASSTSSRATASARSASVESGEGSADGAIKQVKVYVATKQKLEVGDKMAGRHGNKGVVAKIVPEEDMPFLPDGTPVEICLNPLGVPSRMNVGQVLETHLGWACKKLGMRVATPVFDGIPEKSVREYLKEAKLPSSGKSPLYDGRTGEKIDQEVVVGYIYMMKLNHLVSHKIHARAVGPYSLVTQQPLGGKAQYGGQRFGEMEVWALEAYGAAHTLQELLTVKSDDVQGRTKIYESLVKGDNTLSAGTPESFNVLIKEIQSLGLDIKLQKRDALSLGA